MHDLALRLLRWLDAHVLGVRQCGVCGCTEHFACHGYDGRRCAWSIGNWFAGADICTYCAAALHEPRHLYELDEDRRAEGDLLAELLGEAAL